jgi:regulatory protein
VAQPSSAVRGAGLIPATLFFGGHPERAPLRRAQSRDLHFFYSQFKTHYSTFCRLLFDVAFKKSKRTYDPPALYEYAVGALSRRMRSVAELKRLLRQKNIEGDDREAAIEAVIRKLKDQKYLNDSDFAAQYTSYRRSNQKFGKLRVITDLKQKGVHGEVIQKAVTAAYEDVNEEQLAREHLLRKRLKKPTTQKESARIYRALARAGFSSRTIFKVLRKWDVDDETLTALESEETEQQL